jgi:hypothetical protein
VKAAGTGGGEENEQRKALGLAQNRANLDPVTGKV